jgi:ABC-2 type transport system permease protein
MHARALGLWAEAAPPVAYLHIAAKSFQKNLAYRAANLAGIATNTFFGAIYVSIYTALLRDRGTVGGLDTADAVTYAVISQSLLMAMSAFGNRELSEAIIRGQIASDLGRPVDFYLYWAAIDLGRAVYYLIFRGVPTFVLGVLLFHASLPADLGTWLLFFICIVSGMLISFAFRFITNSLAFWTTDARGINYLSNTVIMFFAGFIVPLNFFPPWLRVVAQALPFRGLAALPVNVYLGKLSGPELTRVLAVQTAWFVALVLIGRWVLGRMVQRLTLNGG